MMLKRAAFVQAEVDEMNSLGQNALKLRGNHRGALIGIGIAICLGKEVVPGNMQKDSGGLSIYAVLDA
ncbi:MAG: hypothetical protein OEW15_05475 [Nitrospirota bacterium]|nr:hypothetical protein [Nitrospirota bacterium]